MIAFLLCSGFGRRTNLNKYISLFFSQHNEWLSCLRLKHPDLSSSDEENARETGAMHRHYSRICVSGRQSNWLWFGYLMHGSASPNRHAYALALKRRRRSTEWCKKCVGIRCSVKAKMTATGWAISSFQYFFIWIFDQINRTHNFVDLNFSLSFSRWNETLRTLRWVL